jgi:hypothetical protein
MESECVIMDGVEYTVIHGVAYRSDEPAIQQREKDRERIVAKAHAMGETVNKEKLERRLDELEQKRWERTFGIATVAIASPVIGLVGLFGGPLAATVVAGAAYKAGKELGKMTEQDDVSVGEVVDLAIDTSMSAKSALPK